MTAGKDRLIDLAESKLIENIELGKEKSIIFTLETLGNKRGYTKLIETRDLKKTEDPYEKMSNEELLDLLENTNKKLLGFRKHTLTTKKKLGSKD